MEAHHAFDVHWSFFPTSRLRALARTRAYRWLAHELGIPFDECHFGMFGKEECRRAIALCRAEGPTGRFAVPGEAT